MLDTKVLNSLKGLGEDFLCEIISIYLRDVSGLLARIESAINTQNANEGSLAAHSLKGASYSLGAKGVGDICDDIEKAFDDEKHEGLDTMLGVLKQEVGEAETDMLRVKTKLSRSIAAYSK